MAPWIRDSEGNDALDDINWTPTPADPLIDADASETFGDNPVTRFIDDADDAARDVGGSTAGLPIVGAVGMDGSGDGGFTDTAQDGREWAQDNPLKIKMAIYAVAALAVLVVARPVLEIGANVSG